MIGQGRRPMEISQFDNPCTLTSTTRFYWVNLVIVVVVTILSPFPAHNLILPRQNHRDRAPYKYSIGRDIPGYEERFVV